MKIKRIISILIIALLTGGFLFYRSTITNFNFLETIANCPIDENKQFTSLVTKILFVDRNDEDEYTLEWKISSEIQEKVYLSHDISLLFEDGRLKDTLSVAKKNNPNLNQKLKIDGEDSGHYQAITFHYREFHYPNNISKSIQSMSMDEIYVLDSPLSRLEVFKEPKTESEIEGKRILDTIIGQNQHYTWQELIDYFQIKSENYHALPLTKLSVYNNKPLPELSFEQTQEMLALTWEAIYKHYFLGIEKHDGTTVSPLGSTEPLIMFHKSYTHITIIFQSDDGKKYNIIKSTGRF